MLVLAGCGGPGSGWNPIGWFGSGSSAPETLVPDGGYPTAQTDGRLPLAHSARCFTARHFNLQKDTCEFRCLQFADGIPLKTREGEPFLTLNGIQTQSAHVHTLLADLPAVVADGIDILRISPQGEHTAEIVDLFRRAVDGLIPPMDALTDALPLLPDEPCNGFWHGRPGVEQFVTL